MNLSPHFTLEELTRSEIADRFNIDNAPKEQGILDNLKLLAEELENVRDLLNNPIRINSAYRCLSVNDKLGSKPTSAHTKGLAADLTCSGYGTPRDVVAAIARSNLEYDQVILEFDRWVHYAIAPKGEKPRKQKLIIDKNGTRPFV